MNSLQNPSPSPQIRETARLVPAPLAQMIPQLVDARPEPDFERGHLANAVSLTPNAVLVWAERELQDKTSPLHVYGTHSNDGCAQQTKTELEKLGFQNVGLHPFGYTDRPTDEKTEVGPARWEILGCGG